MYTVNMAAKDTEDDLDKRIQNAVQNHRHGQNGAHMRVYLDDPWFDTIKEELEKRGFKNINVPEMVLKGDVYFEW